MLSRLQEILQWFRALPSLLGPDLGRYHQMCLSYFGEKLTLLIYLLLLLFALYLLSKLFKLMFRLLLVVLCLAVPVVLIVTQLFSSGGRSIH